MTTSRSTARTTKFAAVALIAGALLAGCASAGGNDAGDDGTAPTPGTSSPESTGSAKETPVSDIDGEWQLMKGSDAEGAMTINGTPVTLVIAGDSINGQAPCNSFTGDATIDGSTIAVGTIAQTLMACADDARTALETRYLAALENVTTSKLGGGDPATLTLSGPDVALDFTIIEKKAAN